jgi:hypothetical protein
MHMWFFFIIKIGPFVELVTSMVPSRNVLILITMGNVKFDCSNHCLRESVIWTRLSWNKLDNLVQISGKSIPIGSRNVFTMVWNESDKWDSMLASWEPIRNVTRSCYVITFKILSYHWKVWRIIFPPSGRMERFFHIDINYRVWEDF